MLSLNYPHTKPFSIDNYVLANNFNIMLLIQLLPMLMILMLILIGKILGLMLNNMKKK
jgi:hypothetical protein